MQAFVNKINGAGSYEMLLIRSNILVKANDEFYRGTIKRLRGRITEKKKKHSFWMLK